MRLPAVGTRVSLRYRLPEGSVPPLSDVVGHLVEDGPTLRVTTKAGDVVDIASSDVVSVRPLSAAPVRNRDIRNLEHAAALGWPGVEQQWLGGWLLRFGHGSTRRANSAVPLLPTPGDHVAEITDWYAARGVPGLLAAPDRLLTLPPGRPTDGENMVMTRQLTPAAVDDPVALTARPDDEWLALHPREVPVDVLTAVVDGEVVFGRLAGAAVGRGALTVAPDGTRWAGLSGVHVAETPAVAAWPARCATDCWPGRPTAGPPAPTCRSYREMRRRRASTSRWGSPSTTDRATCR